MPRSMLLVFSNPTTPEQEAEYNRWYTDKHIHDVAKVPGVVSATRYRLEKGIELMPGIGGNPQGWLAIYELDARDETELAAFADALKACLAEGSVDVSPALNLTDLSASFALPVSDSVSYRR